MATIDVKDAAGLTVAIEKPLIPGRAAAATSRPVGLSNEDFAELQAINTRTGSVTETAPATDTASSGLNGRLQRVAQRLTSLIALLPTALGSVAAAASLAVTQSTEDVARAGIITETAPATDTASSGLNGRLQRIAQRLTSLIALLPTSLGSKAAVSSLAVTDSTEDIARAGIITETAPATDTASSGLNGRLQRIAQRLTSLIALFPTALTSAGNLKVAILQNPVFTPLGFSPITALSTAVGLGTIPPGTTTALIQAVGQSVHWRDDGTNPTTTVGTILPAGASFWYSGTFAAFKAIELGASAKLNVSFYQEGA